MSVSVFTGGPFWIVWAIGLPFNETRYLSRKEAQRVARAIAKDSFYETYVLKAQSCHQQQMELIDFVMVPFGVGAPCPYHKS